MAHETWAFNESRAFNCSILNLPLSEALPGDYAIGLVSNEKAFERTLIQLISACMTWKLLMQARFRHNLSDNFVPFNCMIPKKQIHEKTNFNLRQWSVIHTQWDFESFITRGSPKWITKWGNSPVGPFMRNRSACEVCMLIKWIIKWQTHNYKRFQISHWQQFFIHFCYCSIPKLVEWNNIQHDESHSDRELTTLDDR